GWDVVTLDEFGGERPRFRRKAASASDGHVQRAGHARLPEFRQDCISGLLGKGAERGPLAPHHAELGYGAVQPVDEMAARNAPSEFVVAARQRPYAAIAEHDVLRPDLYARKYPMQRLQYVVPLLGLAANARRPVDPNVGGTGQHPAEIGKNDADPAIGMLEEDHVAAKRGVQFGMVQDQVRPFRAGHEGLNVR